MTRNIQTLTTPIIIPDSTTLLRKPELTKQFHPLPFPSFYRLIRSCMIYLTSTPSSTSISPTLSTAVK